MLQVMFVITFAYSNVDPCVGSALEFRPCPSEDMAAWKDRIPAGRCDNETAVANWLDEQLHETRGGLLPHRLSAFSLAGRIPLVSSETCRRH